MSPGLDDAESKLLRIDSKKRELYALTGEQRARKQEEIIESAIQWATQYPTKLGFLVDIALGEGGNVVHYRSPNPLLIRTLGILNSPYVVPRLTAKLEACKKKVCFHTKEMLSALMMISGEDSFKNIKSLLKKTKNNRLVNGFIKAFEEKPRIEFLPVLLDVIRKTKSSYKLGIILAKLANKAKLPILDLLRDKSNSVRFGTIEALNLLPEDLLTEDVLSRLSEIAFTNREDILARAYSSDLLQKKGMPFPDRFRKRPSRNVSSNIPRFVEGTLFPEKRPVDWAISESVEIRYEKDLCRVEMSSVRGTIFCDVRKWRGCFWDVFKMGLRFDFKGKSSKVRGLCRGRRFESDEFDFDYIKKNLDMIVVGFTDDLERLEGERYIQTIKTINRAIATKSALLVRGAPFWEVDWEKIQLQGGCPPPVSND